MQLRRLAKGGDGSHEGDLSHAIATEERRLANIYRDKDYQQRQLEARIGKKRKETLFCATKRPQLVRQLVGGLQRARPRPLPADLKQPYEEIENLWLQL